MIRPKKVKLPDIKTVDRLFLRFIDKNGIVIESPSDIFKCSVLFSECIKEYFLDKWGEDDD